MTPILRYSRSTKTDSTSETGPDATTLLIGQLILVDSFIRGRDNPNVQLLWGLSDGYTPQSKRFMADNWRHAGFAEYTIAPLENVFPLNEKILCQDLGYSFAELVYLQLRFVTYGGFRGINLQAGERIIIAPATGSHSGAGVGVALAMGAQVVAVGRNIDALKTLQNQFPQIDVAQITGDMATDTTTLQSFGTIDAVLDISPAQAKNSTHLTSCFNALKPYGRISLMGVIDSNIAIPYIMLMGKNATIKGQYMYRREDVEGLIKLAEAGILKLGKAGKSEVVGSYKLEQVEEALGAAEQMKGVGKLVVFEP